MKIEVETVSPRACTRCGGVSYVTAKFAHPSYLYPEYQPESGMVFISLCPRCDARVPSAHGLLAFFAFHKTATSDHAEEIAELVHDWISGLPTGPDQKLFEQDVEAYKSGEFDE